MSHCVLQPKLILIYKKKEADIQDLSDEGCGLHCLVMLLLIGFGLH